MADKILTAGLEDYLETIYVAASEHKTVKGIDIAKMLNISRASVSEALAKLVSKGLITYESYGAVSLTPTGLSEARKVYNTHNTLKTFFQTKNLIVNKKPVPVNKEQTETVFCSYIECFIQEFFFHYPFVIMFKVS